MRDPAGMKIVAPARLALALVLAAAASCGGGSAAPQTESFLGPWTFTSGTLTPVCGQGLMVPAFPLAGLSVVFMKVDATTISLTAGAAGCTVRFKVSGATATAEANQTCTLDVGGALGTPMIAVNKWTLKLSGDRIDSDISGAVVICTATGMGVLTRGAPDAGQPRSDAGRDVAAETGGDTAAEAGGETAAEAGGDAVDETGGSTDGGIDAAEASATEGGADGDEAGASDAAENETGG